MCRRTHCPQGKPPPHLTGETNVKAVSHWPHSSHPLTVSVGRWSSWAANCRNCWKEWKTPALQSLLPSTEHYILPFHFHSTTRLLLLATQIDQRPTKTDNGWEESFYSDTTLIILATTLVYHHRVRHLTNTVEFTNTENVRSTVMSFRYIYS